jgi:transcription antitermination factor NusG
MLIVQPWYAIHIRTCHEKACATRLQMKGYEVFLPLYVSRRKWADRFKEIQVPLFPNYLFCRFDARVVAPILTTPGVLRIVGNGNHPVSVDDREIEWIRAVMSSGLSSEPWHQLVTGGKVKIGHGPLRGVEGTFVSMGRGDQLVITVTLLQRSVVVSVDPAWIESPGGVAAPPITDASASHPVPERNMKPSFRAQANKM